MNNMDTVILAISLMSIFVLLAYFIGFQEGRLKQFVQDDLDNTTYKVKAILYDYLISKKR
jgi:hypothetical protein